MLFCFVQQKSSRKVSRVSQTKKRWTPTCIFCFWPVSFFCFGPYCIVFKLRGLGVKGVGFTLCFLLWAHLVLYFWAGRGQQSMFVQLVAPSSMLPLSELLVVLLRMISSSYLLPPQSFSEIPMHLVSSTVSDSLKLARPRCAALNAFHHEITTNLKS